MLKVWFSLRLGIYRADANPLFLTACSVTRTTHTHKCMHTHTHTQDELGLSRELMFKLPPQKRWELYLSKQKVKRQPCHLL